MVDFELIPHLQRAELLKAIAAPVREYFHEPVNAEKFQAWLKKEKS